MDTVVANEELVQEVLSELTEEEREIIKNNGPITIVDSDDNTFDVFG
jgi:hypothetical protein